ncbi:MAG: folate family ECF transporter S component [Ethanoligenens sp.]
MKNVLHLFAQSTRELHRISTLSVAGILLAVSVAISTFTVVISSTLQIRFDFLPLAAGGMLFGPVVGGVMGVASDILDYFVRPNGPFFPGFTCSALLTGVLYGCFLYKKPVTWKRVVLVSAINTVLVNLLLNSVWLSVMYHNAFLVLLTGRIIQNLILFPINTALLLLVLRAIQEIRVRTTGTAA